MSGLKTIVAAIVTVSTLAHPVQAARSLHHVFADCAGRFSAEVEHAWLIQNSQSDLLAYQREAFIALVEATGGDREGHSLNLRIEAKAAQAALLSEARFGTDADRAEWARRRAAMEIATCRLLLLGG